MITINGAVRVGEMVYMPNNKEHAVALEARLSPKQLDRLKEAGSISIMKEKPKKKAEPKKKAAKTDNPFAKGDD
jgi:hypothetical protein